MFGFKKKKPADTFWDNAGEPYILIRVRFKIELPRCRA